MARRPLATVVDRLRHLLHADSGADSDARLLEQFTGGQDEGAFAALLDRHGRMVFNVCRRVLRHEQDAEDAFQATFLILARRAGALERSGTVAGWLHTVAYHTSLRARTAAVKRRARETPIEEEPLERPPVHEQPDLKPVLDEELDRLPAKYRAPLVLCYLEGKSNEEAARQLSWPTGTVKGRLSRARDLLRERLERRGIALSAAAFAAGMAESASAAVPPALLAATGRLAHLSAAGEASTNVQALSEGVLHAMFISKLKIAAACGAVLLVLGIGLGSVGLRHLDVHHAVAVPDVNDKKKLNPDNSERVRNFLELVKRAPAHLGMQECINEVRPAQKFSDEELHALVPELLKLLEDKTPTPYEKPVLDAGTMQVRHRACRALSLLAGISFGSFPVLGGLAAGPRQDNSRALVADWNKWWERSQGKSRQTWLEERRPLLREQFGLVEGKKPSSSYQATEALYLIEALQDKAALPDLLAALKKGTPALKLQAGSSSPDANTLTRIVDVFGRMGDRSLVKELVPLARQVNSPEAGYVTTLLHSYESTLNKLAGTDVKALTPADLTYQGKVLKSSVIKEEAFAAWLKAVE